MRTLNVFIEIEGRRRFVGTITGDSYKDAAFQYNISYMDSEYGNPISISLPFREESFSSDATRNFFESLLPEGFSRRAVANWMKVDDNDYLSILAGLGRECLGAICIIEGDEQVESHYESITDDDVRGLASEGATKSTEILIKTHLSLAGASGKVGLLLDDGNWFLPRGDAPSTHIVKQSHVRLNRIVLNEELCMMVAKSCGIDVADSFIINIGKGEDENILYATKRYDRILHKGRDIDGISSPLRLHQEDFAQALSIASIDKYEKEDSGYLRRMFELIRGYAVNPLADQEQLLRRIIFNYLIGNTDCHVKNYALLYDESLKKINLAPAYDIVSTRVYNTTEEMSFYIGGELNINKINRKHFVAAANDMGLGSGFVEKTFDNMADTFEDGVKKSVAVLADEGYDDVRMIGNNILNNLNL